MRPRRTIARAGLAIGLLLAAASPAIPATQPGETRITLERRGGRGELRGVLLDMDARGVRVRSERLGERTVTWDRIRRVRGEAGDDPRLDGWLAEGTRLWRARTRLERGDPLAAEPLLAELADRFARRDDAMAGLVFEGLLRCRMARGAHDEAIVPMLHVLRLRAIAASEADAEAETEGGAPIRTSAFDGLPPVIDPVFGLVPSIPPAWHQATDRLALEQRLTRFHERLRTDARAGVATESVRRRLERVAAVAACYLEAVRRERGAAAGPLPDPGADAGLRVLVAAIDGEDSPTLQRAAGAGGGAADEPDPDDQVAAARRLLEPSDALVRDRERPAWVRDWASFFEGRRALASEDAHERELGLVRLLRVPALHGVERPYLAGLALDRAADHLRASGRTAEADVLQADLDARFRGHPDASPDVSSPTESPDP